MPGASHNPSLKPAYNLAQEVNTEALQMFELFTEHYLYLEPIICSRADVGAQNLPAPTTALPAHLQLLVSFRLGLTASFCICVYRVPGLSSGSIVSSTARAKAVI